MELGYVQHGGVKMYVNLPNEYQECRTYWEWAQHHPILANYLIKHVNEGKRSKILGHLLNLIGMRKGLPDYQLPISNDTYHGLWLEVKTQDERDKKQKKEQVDWLEKLRKAGHYANFAYGCDDAIQQTLDYLNNRV